jgi:hypothetical protein
MISLNSIPKKNKDIAWRIITGKAVMVALDGSANEKINVCNETATCVWELIDGKSPIKRIAKELSREYNIGARQIEPQIRDAIEAMLRLGLLVCR